MPYLTTTLVDTIVCLEGLEVIGAFMAEELTQEGTSVINSDRDSYVVTPISNYNRKLMFQHSMQELISNRNIIVLVSSVSSGLTLYSALECLSYYGGKLAGISAYLMPIPKDMNMKLILFLQTSVLLSYFTVDDCPLCKRKKTGR